MNCNTSFGSQNISSDYCYLTGSRTIGFIGRGNSINECLNSIENLYNYFIEHSKGLITKTGNSLLKSSDIVGHLTSNYNLYNEIDDDLYDNETEMTYANSGVDDKKVENILKRCLSAVKKTHNNNVGSSGNGKGGGGFFGEYEDLLT